MNILLVRLYPFVYMSHKDRVVFLYNTLQATYEEFIFEKPFSVANKTAFIVYNTTYNKASANKLEQCHYGFVDEVDAEDVEVLADYSTSLSDYYKQFFSKESIVEHSVSQLAKRLFICFSDTFDVFTGYEVDGTESITQETMDHFLSNIHKLSTLDSIIIYANWQTLYTYKQSVKELSNRYNVTLNISLTDYMQHRDNIEKYNINVTNVIISNVENNMAEMERLPFSCKGLGVIMFVRNTHDYDLTTRLNLSFAKNVNIRICPQSNTRELIELMCYTSNDIMELNNSINDVIRNEWINSLYWGDIFINVNGDIMSDKNNSIGNIKEWENIKFEQLLSDSSLWRDTRCKFNKCETCNFRNICPPLSYMEKATNNVFCNI